VLHNRKVTLEATVHFIHQSLKDYLLSSQEVNLFSPSLSQEHEKITHRCLRYIDVFNTTRREKRATDNYFQTLSMIQDLENGLDYPMRYWTQHGQLASNILSKSDIYYGLFTLSGSTLLRAWMYRFSPWPTAYERAIRNQVPIQHFAAFQGMIWVLELLLKRGSKTAIDKIFTQDDSTPLMWAIEAANLETVRWLLEKGASVDVHRFLGDPQIWGSVETAVTLAAKKDLRIFELLLTYGADVHQRYLGGQTPLSILLTEPQRYVTRAGETCELRFNPDLGAVRLLLDHGADPTIILPGGETPLHWVAQSRNIGLMDLLLTHGANPNVHDTEGQSPLHWAAYTGDFMMADLLIKQGAQVLVIDAEGHSAIYYAARNGSEEIVKALLQVDGSAAQLEQFEDGSRGLRSKSNIGKVW
jgi:ankyrin repeat protein